MLLWKVSGLVLPQWGQNWNFCFLFSCGVFFNFHHREQSETYAANVISLFLNSKVLILWAFKNLVTLKKNQPLSLITVALLLDKICFLLAKKNKKLDRLSYCVSIIIEDNMCISVIIGLFFFKYLRTLKIWKFWSNSLSDH